MQHEDPRAVQVAEFPPPGFKGQQVPHHLAPDHTEPPALTAGGSVDENFDGQEYGDYFGSDVRHRFVMPDGKQWIEFKELSEGDIARYQDILNRDVTVEKGTGNARLKINQVEERHALLQVAIVDWHMMKRDQRTGRWMEQKFSNNSKGSEFMKWVMVASPRIVADLEAAVRRENPFLLQASTETLEAIDKQIEELRQQREQILERMRGEEDSATS